MMIIIILVGVIAINYFVLTKLDDDNLGLINSIIFFVNSIFLVVLSYSFLTLSSSENPSFQLESEQLIAINSFAFNTIYIVILLCLFNLSLGTYQFYNKTKKKPLKVISIFFLVSAILVFIGYILAGSFAV